MTTQINKYTGWPPSIPMNCEGQKIKLVVTFRARVLVVRPYLLTSKYPYYKKEANLDVHVRVFDAVVRENGKTLEEYSSMYLVIYCERQYHIGVIITCYNFLTISFLNR
jgi:hypothetical protein